MILLPMICAAYLLGAIPTGLLVGRLAKGVDVRQHGSGNVGATNVVRVVGKAAGFLVLLVDAAKGWLPVALLAPLATTWGVSVAPEKVKILLGLASVAGHVWNPFLQFQGGRGVATGLGVLAGLDLRVALGSLGVWVLVALTTRYVSVASISAAFSVPFLMIWIGSPTLWILGGVGVSLIIISRHRPNILRLLHGEEHRFGKNPNS